MAGKGNYRAYMPDYNKIDQDIIKKNLELKLKGEEFRYVRYDVHTIGVTMVTFLNWDSYNKNDKKRLLKKWQKHLLNNQKLMEEEFNKIQEEI